MMIREMIAHEKRVQGCNVIITIFDFAVNRVQPEAADLENDSQRRHGRII